jgi:hypothetical protein
LDLFENRVELVLVDASHQLKLKMSTEEIAEG